MPTELAQFIANFDIAKPGGEETLGEADDHLRLIKSVITETFNGSEGDRWDTALNVGPRYLNELQEKFTLDNYMDLTTAQTAAGVKTFEDWVRVDTGIMGADSEHLISQAEGQPLTVGNVASAMTVAASTPDSVSVSDGTTVGVVLHTANWQSQLIDTIYPVGSVLYSADNVNPGARFTGTTWVQISQGRFVAGVGSATDANGTLGTVEAGDDSSGVYTVTLTTNELPAHTHVIQTRQGAGSWNGEVASGDTSSAADHTTESTGGGQEFVTYPPLTGLYVWQRTE